MNKKVFSLLTIVILIAVAIIPNMVTAQELSGTLEILNWWAGDEGPALKALINLYNANNPDVIVINAAVTGGAGTNAKAVLKTRMLGGDPPDTFQVHAGQELTGTYVIADQMEDLTFLYEQEGWMDKFPQGLLDLMSYEGGIYSVALNIHRSNVMWYVPAKLEEWGVTAPATWDDFLAACPTLQEKGVLPLSVGENWTQTHLWESVAVASLGAENWNKLWAGELDPAGAEMLAVWDLFGKVLDCTNINEDAAGLSWQQATDKVVNGEAAFNIMGDWAAGYMTTTLGLVPGEGFGYVPSPGTDGTFIMLADSFGLPVGIANRDSAVAWLSLVGSVEGQNTFNPLKGSIPARLDADVANNDAYNAYLKSAAEDWGTDTVVGSLAHGAAANENFSGSFSSVLEIFIPSRDPAAATAVMVELCTSSSACGSME